MTILDPTPTAPEADAVDPDDYAARVERLRAAIQVGLDEFARGEAIEITDIGAFFRDLEAEVEAEFD